MDSRWERSTQCWQRTLVDKIRFTAYSLEQTLVYTIYKEQYFEVL